MFGDENILLYAAIGVGVAYVYAKLGDSSAEDEDDFSCETVAPRPIHKAPKKNIKEYTLNDGSTVAIDKTKTEVQEKEVFDPFGFDISDSPAESKTPAEKIGGGMAEIIRKRREEGVF
jgi:hypothetical protein